MSQIPSREFLSVVGNSSTVKRYIVENAIAIHNFSAMYKNKNP